MKHRRTHEKRLDYQAANGGEKTGERELDRTRSSRLRKALQSYGNHVERKRAGLIMQGGHVFPESACCILQAAALVIRHFFMLFMR